MIDVHCHLEHMEDPEAVIKEAKERGMRAIITSVADPKDLSSMLALRREHRDFLYLCAGFHPHHVNDYTDEEIKKYMQMIRSAAPEIIGIGEIGLEYRGNYDAIRQQDIFKEFIDLAIELNKPVVLHCREAWNDAPRILAAKKTPKVIFHCYSGTDLITKFAIAQPSWYISFATNATYTKKHPRLMEHVPLSRMLLETDSPWLDPEHPPGKEQQLVNRPWKITHTAELAAKVKSVTAEEILKHTTENALNVFNIPNQ